MVTSLSVCREVLHISYRCGVQFSSLLSSSRLFSGLAVLVSGSAAHAKRQLRRVHGATHHRPFSFLFSCGSSRSSISSASCAAVHGARSAPFRLRSPSQKYVIRNHDCIALVQSEMPFPQWMAMVFLFVHVARSTAHRCP